MVVVGETDAGTPLVTAILPGVITPVPFEKTPVSCEFDPDVTVAGFAVKVLMEGFTGFADTLAAQEVEPIANTQRIAAQPA